MSFQIKPTVFMYETISDYLSQNPLRETDLVLTNEYILAPHINIASLPCQVIFQEKYGKGEPSDQMIDSILCAIQNKTIQRIIAIGGGTVIDIAKLLLFSQHQSCEAIFALGPKLVKDRTLIAIPTTCGTGSEMTNISIVNFIEKKSKIGLAVPALYADEAVLINELFETLPWNVFATSSVDALIHCIESYLSPKSDTFSKLFSEAGITRILNGYKALEKEGKDYFKKIAQEFAIASCMGGIAFGNAGCAAVHALSYPIGAFFHIPHGESNYQVFLAVIQKYIEKGCNLHSLEQILCRSLKCKAEKVWQSLGVSLDHLLTHQKLHEYGMQENQIEEFADSVLLNQQRLLQNNPIPLSRNDIIQIYQNLY